MVNGLSQLLQSLGTVRVAVLGGVAIGLIALIMFMATRIGNSDYALLFGNLEPEDSSAVVTKLEALNIPYQLSADGRNIKVPSDMVARARLDVAQDGLPNGGSIGYEIFDNTDTFGTTSFVQNVNLVRALEGELARTIRSIGNVATARVHLVLPKRQVFSREKRDASASIIVKLKGRLRDDQISAIQHLVAAAVPTLDVNRISIVDDKGNLLARGDGKDNPGKGFGSQTEFLRVTHESRLREQIEALLERSLGKGNARVQVSALMDFDQKTVKSETYDPDGQVVRSTQTIEENSSSSDTSGNNEGVTVANNLPEAAAGDGRAAGSQSDAARVEETVNYEISKTVTTEVSEVGNVRRLTVAVLVNGRSAVAEDGTTTYQALNDEELEQVSRLVKSSIGFDEERGDLVEVVNMPFVELAPVDIGGEPVDETIFLGFDKQDLFRMGEMAVLAIVAVLALLLVVRPLLNRALTADATGNALAAPGAIGGAIGGVPGAPTVLPDGTIGYAGGGAIEGPTAPDGTPIQSETLTELDEMIDIAKVDGQVKTSALKKVGEIVEKHPDEAVAILRNWLYHEA